MRKNWTIETIAAVVLIAGSAASAQITVTQGASAPTYSNTLNFDEPGGPVGDGLANDAFAALGISSMMSGDGFNRVGNFDAATGSWGLGGGTNSFTGYFGVFMNFDTDLTEMSLQAWDPSGPPSPFGGGLSVFVFNDGVEVGSMSGTPAWGGVGDSWWNITTTSGAVFDEVRILGFGFDPATYVDDLSWNAVPTPTGVAAFGVAGLALARRRRA